MTLFDRDDLIGALRDLVTELRAAGEPIGMRIVGGGALSLKYFERASTRDVDVFHVRPGTDEAVASAARTIAWRRGWDEHWLNFDVTKTAAEPQWGKDVEWETIFDEGGIVIQVASAEALLVMKLRANRPGRDTDDIRQLLALCNIDLVQVANELYEEYYPGESLPDRAWDMVVRILSAGPLTKPDSPDPVELAGGA
jgi:predicted nucleotidyltransferase